MTDRLPVVRKGGQNVQIPAGDALLLRSALNEATPQTFSGSTLIPKSVLDLANTIHFGESDLTQIGDLAVSYGAIRRFVFTGVTVLHNSSTMILFTSADITTAAGDVALFESLGGANWRMIDFARFSGAPLLSAGASDPTKLPLVGGKMTGAINEANPVSLVIGATVSNTVDLGSSASNTVLVSGSGPLQFLGNASRGTTRRIQFNTAVTISNTSRIILPSGADIVTAVGDTAEFINVDDTNIWKCLWYQRASGTSLVGAPDSTKLPLDGSKAMTGPFNQAAQASLNAASVVNIGGASSDSIYISGAATINSFSGGVDGMRRQLQFAAGITLAAGLVPGGVRTTLSGDNAEFQAASATAWRCLSYTKADGTPLVSSGSGPANTDQLTEGTTNLYFTTARAQASLLTGFTSSTGTVTAADSILVALGKLQGTKVDAVAGKGLSTNDYTTAEQSKLAGIAAGATVNSTDAALRDRSTHTGTQAISTVTGLQTALDAKAPLASPALTGTPTAPTATSGTNTTQLATTAFVAAAVSSGGAATNLGATQAASTVTVTSSTGTSAVLPAATATLAGVLIAADKSKLDGIASGAQVNAVTSVSGRTGAVVLTKSDVGLSSVDNTADTAKPVSTAQQSALDLKAPLASPALTGTPTAPTAAAATNTTQLATTAFVTAAVAAAPGGATNLGVTTAASTLTVTSSSGTSAVLPAATVSLAGVQTAGDKSKLDGITAGAQPNVATNLGVTTSTTTVTVTSSTGTSAVIPTATASIGGTISASDKTKLDGVAAGAQVNTVTSVAGRTGVVVLAKADVGLGSVDNTADTAKPVSTAQQAALDLKAPLASPALTGTPTTPTATAGTNTTQVASTAFVTAAAATKEPTVTAGTSAQYWSGVKAFVDFATSVRAAVLTGLDLTVSTAVVAGDTLLVAIGKLQSQITALTTTVAAKLSLTGGTLTGKLSGTVLSMADYLDKVTVNAAATGTATLDLSVSSVFDLTLTGNTALAFSNIPALTNEIYTVVVTVRQGTTAFTLTQPSGVTVIKSAAIDTPGASKQKDYIYSTKNGTAWELREGAST
ncbi:hypothetical protein ACI2KS_10400 [Pseudomonas sp. NPDC087358]|uniref:hypothetical protein n=1 Tax=Pseudomonas sp. NPDC087358 TaxID=3364439 RepID=UPI00385181B2